MPVPWWRVPDLAIFLIGSAVAALRIAVAPWSSLWKDWILILGLYAMARSALPRGPGEPALTAATMSFLLGIYVHGQWPHLLSVLGFTS